MARSRRHAEAKRQRAARKEKERDKADGGWHDELRQQSASPVPAYNALLASPAMPPTNHVPSPLISPHETPNSIHLERFQDGPLSPRIDTPDMIGARNRELGVDKSISHSNSPITRTAQEPSLPASPSDSSQTSVIRGERSPQARNQATPTLGSSQSLGVSSPAFGASSSRGCMNVGLGVGPVGLGVPTSKAERRRSINPAMTFNMDAHNSTFAVEPRLSPLPPSPLRASFTDAQPDQPLRSSTSPTPSYLGTESFPFRGYSTGPSIPSETGHRPANEPPPPRTSSLPDVLSNSRSYPVIAEDEEESFASNEAPPRLPPTLPSGQLSSDGEGSTPRLRAPDLPPMTFSLSDPDFAIILDNIDRSPVKGTHSIPRSRDSSSTAKQDTDGSSDVGSGPSSPVNGTSPALARSPQMDMLSCAVETESSRSPSRTRLSPNDQMPTPQLLRTRQPSAESTTSVASKLGPGSAFATIVEMVAKGQHVGQDTVPVDLNVLSEMIAEMEDLKDIVTGLKNKYTGAKVSVRTAESGLGLTGDIADKPAVQRRFDGRWRRIRQGALSSKGARSGGHATASSGS